MNKDLARFHRKKVGGERSSITSITLEEWCRSQGCIEIEKVAGPDRFDIQDDYFRKRYRVSEIK